MGLEEKIYNDFLKALKEKDKIKKELLSYLRAELKNRAKLLKKELLTDAEVIEILRQQKKKMEEAARLVASSGKEAAQKEIATELSIISSYLPALASREEVQKVVEEVIAAGGFSSMKDMGAVMKASLAKLGVRADKASLSKIVKEKLSAS